VELSQDRSDVFSTGRAANQTSSGVLDGLKALQVDNDKDKIRQTVCEEKTRSSS